MAARESGAAGMSCPSTPRTLTVRTLQPILLPSSIHSLRLRLGIQSPVSTRALSFLGVITLMCSQPVVFVPPVEAMHAMPKRASRCRTNKDVADSATWTWNAVFVDEGSTQ